MAGGRRKLVGELLGIDAGEVIIQDEAADDVLRAPLVSLQLGEKTALAPRNADSGPLKFSMNGILADEEVELDNNRIDLLAQFIF